tara:strand:- start:317 stop:952 length:636 start_codon:yes stop_codon:yes gene_type:complete
MIESFMMCKKNFLNYFILKITSNSRYLLLLLVFLSTLTIVSCNNIDSLDKAINWEDNQTKIISLTDYSIIGSISFKNTTDSFLGNYTINHQNNAEMLILRDFFGKQVFSSVSTDFASLLMELGIDFSSDELKTITSLNINLSSLLLANIPSERVDDMVMDQHGFPLKIYLNNHQVDFAQYQSINELMIPKKIVITGIDYQATFSIKNFSII